MASWIRQTFIAKEKVYFWINTIDYFHPAELWGFPSPLAVHACTTLVSKNGGLVGQGQAHGAWQGSSMGVKLSVL